MKLDLYKIIYNIEIQDLNDIFDHLTEIEKERIYSMNIISSFYYDIDNKYIGYLLLNSNELELYENILNDNLIPYICVSYSRKVLNNEIDIESELEKYCDLLTIQNFNNFIHDINKWILENLDLDSILDRISLYGIETLRPIDKEYLKGF